MVTLLGHRLKVWDVYSFPYWTCGKASHGNANPKRQPNVARNASSPGKSPSALGRSPAPMEGAGLLLESAFSTLPLTTFNKAGR